MMKHRLTASVVGLLASAPAVAWSAAPQAWFVLNPSTSTCNPSQSPREEDTYMRSVGIIPDLEVHRSPDGTLQGVALNFTQHGTGGELDYWPTKAACLGFRDYMIKHGTLLPPDIQ